MMRAPRLPRTRILSLGSVFLLVGTSLSMASLSLGALLLASTIEGYKMDHAKTLSYVLLITLQLSQGYATFL